MTAYRALRDFGSHLGNHRRGDQLSLPDGPLPRGFDGLVEKVPEAAPAPKPEYVTKDVVPAAERTTASVPASDRANVAPADAGMTADLPAVAPAPPLQDDVPADPPHGDKGNAPPSYDDKMVRDRNASKRRPS